MLLETNYLSYKRDSGRQGDVGPRQNNFAGLGATGGGVPGDSFPDVSTGVLAQMQHLLAYSGERVAKPLAPRTREKQDDIIALSRALRRPVRFDDLTNRWAKDRNYAKSIEWVAERYRSANCTETGAPLKPAEDDAPTERQRIAGLAPAAPTRAPGLRGACCQLWRLGRRADPLDGRHDCQLHGPASGRRPRAVARPTLFSRRTCPTARPSPATTRAKARWRGRSSFARRHRPDGVPAPAAGPGPGSTGEASLRVRGASTASWARGGAVRLTGARRPLSVTPLIASSQTGGSCDNRWRRRQC